MLNLYIIDDTEDMDKHLDQSKSLPPGTYIVAPPPPPLYAFKTSQGLRGSQG